MRNVVIAISFLLLTAQCRQKDPEVAPSLAKLVGTWQLIGPDSSSAITLQFALDIANPPRDITHFLARGKLPVNTYTAFLSAAVDGYLVVTDVSSTHTGGSLQAAAIEQLYLADLREVVRFELPAVNQLRLYHGGTTPGSLVYRKI